MDIRFGAADGKTTIAVAALADGALTTQAAALDATLGGVIARAIAGGRFKGKPGQSLTLHAPTADGPKRVLVIGIGEAEKLDASGFERAGGDIYAAIAPHGDDTAQIDIAPPAGCAVDPAEAAARIGFGAALRSYVFDRYKSEKKEEDKPALKTITIAADDAAAAQSAYAPLGAVAAGVALARDLQNEPANILYPESFADRCAALSADGLEVEVLDEAKMTELGMGALLGVGQGSVRESRLVVMRWNGGAKDDAPLCFVGKGVCFDTGGISIKPAGGMEDMKWDMGGAGVVTGLMKALAGRKAKANVIGVVGLVENMPDGDAQRPGDIVTSMSGKTIEVLNTDAEGRLVLADALWYAQDRYKPKLLVDLATLTGAIIIALGEEYCGMFSNSDDLAAALANAGESSGEKAWRLPLGEAYDRDIDSDWADVKNIGGGRSAGSITAAQFLQRFVNETTWAHLDIAGVTWTKKDKPTVPKGATGFGVRMLDRFVKDNHEG